MPGGVASGSPAVWVVANTTWNVFNFRRHLIERLQARGYPVTALSPADDYVARVRALGVRHVHLQMDNAGTNPLLELATIVRLTRLFGRERPGLLLTFTPKANIYCSIAARLAGVPVIANVSGLGTGFIRGGWLTHVMRLLYRVAFRHPQKVFFQNAEDERLFVAQNLVAQAQSERLPGSGVDVERFRPAPGRAPGGPFVFLMIARLLRDKGVREYAAAAGVVRSRHRAVEFRLGGFLDANNPTAISREEISQWERRGWLRFLGSTDDPAAWYAEADCVVLPSYREGCPRTLLEASSMALPAIAADVPGCRQVVDDGRTGLLARAADAADLAEKMERMLTLPEEERRSMGRLARQKMLEHFDERLVIARYCDAVAEIVPAPADRYRLA